MDYNRPEHWKFTGGRAAEKGSKSGGSGTVSPEIIKTTIFTKTNVCMEKEIRKQAKKNHRAKQAFYITAAVFAAISILLLVVSTAFESAQVAFWIRLPILVLSLTLGIVYVSMFGFSLRAFSDKEGWEEEQIEKEIRRLYRQRRTELPPGEDLSPEETLELKELERLKRKWYDYDELV